VGNPIRTVEDNVEATEAWNGPLFDIWIEYRDIVAEGLRDHGESALAANPPHEGDRVLDIGCGLGDTTVRLAGLVGAAGHAYGVDVAERMIETAIEEAAEAGLENVSFATCDVEVTKFDRTFDYAFSRMGTMFFANPVAALRNVREALAPGGLLNMVVWRRKLDNEFMHRAELVVAEYLEEPEEFDVPRCGPGPFSMANADTVTDVLTHAGYEDIRLARQDLPYKIGNDLEQAVAFSTALGPAAEVLRLWGERVHDIRPKIAADLRSALADFVVDGGAVVAPSSTWAVTARRGSSAHRDELVCQPTAVAERRASVMARGEWTSPRARIDHWAGSRIRRTMQRPTLPATDDTRAPSGSDFDARSKRRAKALMLLLKAVCRVPTDVASTSGRSDLNRRPFGPQPNALPGCATPRAPGV
jgi:SAM-dependent methyltransferase